MRISKSFGGVLLSAALLLTNVSMPAAEARHGRSHSSQKHFRVVSSRHHKGKHVVAAPALPQQVGVLVVSESGKTVMDELSDNEFNPASVAKLVTAYGAIKTFGLEHRFATKLVTDGSFSKESGVLTGDLYVQGIDPDFDRNDAVALKSVLSEAGVKKVTGKLVVAPTFSYGSAGDPLWSAHNLNRVWSRNKSCSVSIAKGVVVGQAPDSVSELGEYDSEPLRDTLKEMLSYSKNNVAEQIGRSAGGINKLENIVTREAGLAPGALKLASASGLGKNRVKPKDMMLVLKGLRSELQTKGLDLQDICPVAGVDGGTLDERFTTKEERGSVVGKTGTLPGTDGGTSALVGMFRAQKEDFYFVIFCWRGNVVSFRHQQDELIRKLQSARGGAKPFEYKASL